MKKLLTIFAIFISIGASAQTVGIKIATPIIKNNPGDNTITGYADLLNGGFHIVTTTAGRDSLSVQYSTTLRTAMLCYVIANSTYYQWNGSSWVVASFGGNTIYTGDGTIPTSTNRTVTIGTGSTLLFNNSVGTSIEIDPGEIDLYANSNEDGYLQLYQHTFDILGARHNGSNFSEIFGDSTRLLIQHQYSSGSKIKSILLDSTANSGIKINDDDKVGFIYISHPNNTGSGTSPQQIPDRAYVDSVATGGLTFNNGLTNTSGVVTLGGALTQNTDIDITGFNFIARDFLVQTGMQLLPTSGAASIFAPDGVGATYRADLSSTGAIFGRTGSGGINQSLTVTPSTIVITDAVNSKGLVAAANYDPNFTSLNYITKHYADATYAPISSGVSSFNSRTGAVVPVAGDYASLTETLTNKNITSGTNTFPTFNQNTTGTASNITATSNSTLTTLSALSLPYSQLTGAPSLTGYVPYSGATGNVNLGSNNITASSFLSGTLGYTATNVLGSLQSSVNAFNQFIIQNSNSGATASADMVVNNNNSTNTTFYGDFGMNSSGFTGSGAFNAPNSVYLTSTTGDLAIGTTTSNAIHFVINSGTTDALTISTAGALTIPSFGTGLVHSSSVGLLSSSAVSLTADVSGILPVANGGTGSGTQNFVDLTTNQTVAGNKNFSGTTTIATPFTLGAVSVTATGTQLNYLNAATGTTGTTSTNVVYSTSPTLVTPTLGAATATSVNGLVITPTAGTLTIPNNASAVLQQTGNFNLNLTVTAATTATFPTGTGTLPYIGAANTWALQQTLSGGLGTAGISSANFFAIGGSLPSSAQNAAGFQFGGSTNVDLRAASMGTTTGTLGNGDSYAAFIVGKTPFTTASASVTKWGASAVFNSLGVVTLGASGASLTNSSTVFINGAITTATNNYVMVSYDNQAAGTNNAWFKYGITEVSALKTDSLLTGTVGTDAIIVNHSGILGSIAASNLALTLPIIGTPTIVAGTGAGTSPTVSVTSNGKQLQVTVTTGTLPTGTNATIATVTLANALTYTPYPVFSSASAATALLNGASMIYMTSTGTANVTITSGTTALTAATTYVWNVSL